MDRENRRKHGVALSRAAEFELDAALILPDNRKDYREDRFVAFGRLGGKLHSLVFTVRDQNVRAISLRRARPEEVLRAKDRYDPD